MLYIVSMNATMLFAQSMKKQVDTQSHSSFSVYTYTKNNTFATICYFITARLMFFNIHFMTVFLFGMFDLLLCNFVFYFVYSVFLYFLCNVSPFVYSCFFPIFAQVY